MEQRILIYAPAGRDAQLAAQVLHGAGMAGFVCASPADVVRELESGAGALLIAEEGLDIDTLSAIARFIAKQPAWSDMPILVLTKYGPDQTILESMAGTLGNVTFLERPVRASGLTSAARSALRARMRQYQVRDLDRRKDEFLASLSHELRNPLAPIRTAMEVLKGIHDLNEVGKVRDVVERQVVYLSRLVDDLLDVARITSGKIQLQCRPVSLAAVVAHATEICEPLFAAGGHQIAVSQPPGDIRLHADQTRLVQSLSNVLANACKFTTRPGTIAFAVTVDGNMVRFSIRDPGRGIDSASLSRIFDMFAQSDSVQDPTLGGLGIGLSLARKFTEMHGGSIHAHSDGIGCGSEFVLTLPIVVTAQAGMASAVPDPADITHGSGLRILVGDDNRDGADMLQMLLEAEGFMVATAYTGMQTVETAGTWLPDAVVIDIGLPDIDGYEAVRRIRRQPGHDTLRIIALTGWGDQDARRLGVEAGIDHHLVKPVDLALLREVLKSATPRGAASHCAQA